MTVLLVNDTIGRVAGSNQACLRISRKLTRAGETVIWTGTMDEATEALAEDLGRETGARIEPLGEADTTRLAAVSRTLVSPRLFRRFESLLRRTKPDWALVCNVHNALSPAVLGALAAHRIPVVFFPFDNWLWCVRKYNHVEGMRQPCRACLERVSMDSLRLGCGGSQATSIWHYAVRKGLAARRIFAAGVSGWIVPTDVYATALRASGVPASRMLRLPFPLDDPDEVIPSLGERFVYYGAAHPAKGLRGLFAALEGMQDFPLDLYLSEPLDGDLDEAFDSAGRGNSLRVHTTLRWTNGLRERVRASRGVVIPSAWDSVGEQTLFESMSFGRPIVASDIEVHREWIRAPVQGMLAPLDDASAFRDVLDKARATYRAAAPAVRDNVDAVVKSQARWAERLTEFAGAIS